jgi:hypothetical protein
MYKSKAEQLRKRFDDELSRSHQAQTESMIQSKKAAGSLRLEQKEHENRISK